MNIREEKGAALLTVLVMIIIVSTLGTALLAMSSTDKKIAVNQDRAAQAFYRAESGVQYALGKLEENNYWQGGSVDLFNDGSPIVINISGSPPLVTVVSSATAVNAQKSVTVDVKMGGGTFGQALLAYGDGGSSTFGNNSYIDGDIIANGNAIFGNNSVVTGLAYVQGVLQAEGSDVTLGEGYPDVQADPFEWEMAYQPQSGSVSYGNNVSLENTVIAQSGSVSFGNNAELANVTIEAGGSISFGNGAQLQNVVIKAQGSISFGNDLEISGSIYSAGSISFGNDLTNISEEDDPGEIQALLLSAAGNIAIGNHDDSSHSDALKGVIFSGQQLTAGNNFYFAGSIAAFTLIVGNNADITFLPGVVNQLTGSGGISLESWQELAS